MRGHAIYRPPPSSTVYHRPPPRINVDIINFMSPGRQKYCTFQFDFGEYFEKLASKILPYMRNTAIYTNVLDK